MGRNFHSLNKGNYNNYYYNIFYFNQRATSKLFSKMREF